MVIYVFALVYCILYCLNTVGRITHKDFYANLPSAQSLSHTRTHKHPSEQTIAQMSHNMLKIPLLPLVVARTQKWPAKCTPLSVYKPLKPRPTNERPVQSVSNPVPIWASLPWASLAFVPWLSEGRAPHAPAELQAFIKYAPSSCCEERSQPANLITGWGPSTYVNLHLFPFKERDSPGLSRTQTQTHTQMRGVHYFTHTQTHESALPHGHCQSRMPSPPPPTTLPQTPPCHHMYLSAVPRLQTCPPFSISLMTSNGQEIALFVIALYFSWLEVTRRSLTKPVLPLKATAGVGVLGLGQGP